MISRLGLFSIAVFVSLIPGRGIAAEETPEVPFDLRPYEVRVVVGFSGSPGFTNRFRREVRENLSAAIERSTGGQWHFEVVETREITPANELGLNHLAAENFQEAAEAPHPLQSTKFDKQYLLTVDQTGSRFQLSGREWDESTQKFGPVLSRQISREALVAETLFRLISQLYQPLLEVVEADVPRKFVRLTLRAGGYIPDDRQANPTDRISVPLRQGSVLIAYFRYHTKEGAVRQVQFLPWTYLIVDRITRGRVEASLVTGIRTPLGAKTSKRVRSLAIGQVAFFDQTKLQIQLSSNARNKLAGHQISTSVEKYPEKDKELTELFRGLTNRSGSIDLPIFPKQEVVWVRVHSGKALLSLVPIAPGFEAHIKLDLPDDSIRLAVEGDLVQVRADLVDTVAKRAAIMIRIRKSAEQKDWKKVDDFFEELGDLDSVGEFRKRISGIQVKATNAARLQKSRLTENRVKDLCETATALVEKYLTEEKINILREEVREARANAN